jgi:excisionase family DNA binding protein
MELLTPRQVAKRLNIGVSTAYLMAQKGILPVVRINRSVRIPSDELDAWIQENTEPGLVVKRGVTTGEDRRPSRDPVGV